MAYGTNEPNGFVPYQIQGIAANPNMQYDENFSIVSGYPLTVAKGDIIWLGTAFSTPNDQTGAKTMLQGVASPFNVAEGASLGIFQGVYLDLPQSNQAQSNGWSDVWTAGTITRTGFPSPIKIIPISQQWTFSIQTLGNATAVPTPAVPYPLVPGQFMTLQYQNVSTTTGNNVYTPNIDGTAPLGVLNVTSEYNIAGPNLVQFLGYPKNSPNGTSQAGLQFGNVIVRLCDNALVNVSV